jgi:squalene-hopene/tetraprenyl-beta-curcumene cyclase
MLPKSAVAAALLIAALPLAHTARAVGPDAKTYELTVAKAIRYLETAQAENGSFSPQVGIGPTALATLAILRCGRAPETPVVAKALAWLETHVQAEGGVYPRGSRLPNYETCVALMCFKEANRDGRYDKLIKGAEAYIRKGQWNEEDGKAASDVYYGGAGYGGPSRPDLSNTAFMIDALESAGADPNDAAIQRALVFVSRCQNLETEHNTTPFAAKVNDGGFYYSCAVDEQDGPRETPDGGLRSYGTMTYAGLKSMLYAGVSKDDPRVKAALGWIKKFYDVENNPGMGDAGLYYYYHTFSKTLDAAGQDEVEDAKGVKHDWRRELTESLAKKQQENGSRINTNRRWLESDPNLATAFGLLALSYCKPK